MMYKLFDVADVIRSKNSGPYELTFDVIFKDYGMFKKFFESNVMTKEKFANMYKIDEKDVESIIYFEPAKALKITIVRPICSGALGESDVYGAQQHAPLLDFKFEI